MAKSKVRKTTFEMIGEVSVDSGSLMIADPCYVNEATHKKASKARGFSGKGGKVLSFAPFLVKDLGFVFESPTGDGKFPVWGEFDEHGTLVSIIVDLER